MLAAVDVQFSTIDVARLICAEKINRFRNFFGLTKALHGNLIADDLLRAWRQDRCIDLAW